MNESKEHNFNSIFESFIKKTELSKKSTLDSYLDLILKSKENLNQM